MDPGGILTMATTERPQLRSAAPGPSVQDVLHREARTQAVPPVLLAESCPDIGLADLPRERYYSREQHDLEVSRMWRKVWQMAGRVDDLPEVGDTLVYDIAEDSIVLVRVSAELIKGYYNTCLHRGTTLRAGDGNVPALRCPMHGWSWNLDGSLRQLPCAWDFPHLDPARLALPEVLVDTWDGWVFINMDPGAEPLRSYLEDIPEHFEQLALPERYKAVHVAGRVPCNWKVALEAFIEGWHSWVSHPQLMPIFADVSSQNDIYRRHISRFITLVGVPSLMLGDFGDQQHIVEVFIRELMQADPSGLEVPDGVTAREFLGELMRGQLAAATGRDHSTLSDTEVLDGVEYLVFPNFTPWPGFGLPIVYRYRPDGADPESCIVDIMLLAQVPEGGERPPNAAVTWIDGEDWTAAPELGALGVVFNQDRANITRMQRGLKTGPKRTVTLSSYQEVRIRHHAQTLETYLEERPCP
jgi:nitrite reductase/ring-hydroxylating ferredoxin subunit